MNKYSILALMILTVAFSAAVSATTFTGASIVLNGSSATINVSECTWTFSELSWDGGGDWLYVQDLTTSNYPYLDSFTKNYTNLSGYYNCGSFPYVGNDYSTVSCNSFMNSMTDTIVLTASFVGILMIVAVMAYGFLKWDNSSSRNELSSLIVPFIVGVVLVGVVLALGIVILDKLCLFPF